MSRRLPFYSLFIIATTCSMNYAMDIDVYDWSSHVVKDEEGTNSNGVLNATHNGRVLFDYAQDTGIQRIHPSKWQYNTLYKSPLKKSRNIRKSAIEKTGLSSEHLTVIAKAYNPIKDTNLLLSDEEHIQLYRAIRNLQSTNIPTTPHVFLLGTIQDTQENDYPESESKVDHWVTCVAHRNSSGKLQLQYADAMNPGSYQELSETDRIRRMEENKFESKEDLEISLYQDSTTAKIISLRKEKLTDLLKELILNSDPLHLLETSPLGVNLTLLSRQSNSTDIFPYLKNTIDYMKKWNLWEDQLCYDTYSKTILNAINSVFNTQLPLRLLSNPLTIINGLEPTISFAKAYKYVRNDVVIKHYIQTPTIPSVKTDEIQDSAPPTDPNSITARLEKIRKKSWFQTSLNKLTEYVTKRTVLLTAFCTTSIWVLNKLWKT